MKRLIKGFKEFDINDFFDKFNLLILFVFTVLIWYISLVAVK